MPVPRVPERSMSTDTRKNPSSRRSRRRYVFLTSRWSRIVQVRPQYAGNTTSAQEAVDRETELKLQRITDAYGANKDAVIKKLLDRVVLFKPELHRNLKKLGGPEAQ